MAICLPSWSSSRMRFAMNEPVHTHGGGGDDRDLMNLIGCAHAVIRLRTDESRAWWACEACRTPFSPATSPAESVDAAEPLEYLSIRQLAGRIPYSEGAIRHM